MSKQSVVGWLIKWESRDMRKIYEYEMLWIKKMDDCQIFVNVWTQWENDKIYMIIWILKDDMKTIELVYKYDVSHFYQKYTTVFHTYFKWTFIQIKMSRMNSWCQSSPVLELTKSGDLENVSFHTLICE